MRQFPRRASNAPHRSLFWWRSRILDGVVDRVDAEGKFGFIIGANGEEYFFHQGGLQGPIFEELGPGTTVLFDVGQDEGDRPDEHLRAVAIRLADDAIPAEDNEPLPPEKVGG